MSIVDRSPHGDCSGRRQRKTGKDDDFTLKINVWTEDEGTVSMLPVPGFIDGTGDYDIKIVIVYLLTDGRSSSQSSGVGNRSTRLLLLVRTYSESTRPIEACASQPRRSEVEPRSPSSSVHRVHSRSPSSTSTHISGAPVDLNLKASTMYCSIDEWGIR